MFITWYTFLTVLDLSGVGGFNPPLVPLNPPPPPSLYWPPKKTSQNKSKIHFCIHGIGPAYFGDVCAPVTAAPGRTNLRSATRGDLVIPRTRTKLGERSFRISASTVWNSLPDSLKHFATSREHFRRELKTYLFRYVPIRTSLWELLKSELTYLLTCWPPPPSGFPTNRILISHRVR